MSSMLLCSNSLRQAVRRTANSASPGHRLASTSMLLNNSSSSPLLGSASTAVTPNAMTTAMTSTGSCRWMSNSGKKKSKKRAINGSRGSRGHGWYLKYRQGRGGRHLQGVYWDRREHHWDMQQWNDAILALGSQFVYVDVAVEPPAGSTAAASTAAAAGAEEQHEEIEIDVSADVVGDEEEDAVKGETEAATPPDEEAVVAAAAATADEEAVVAEENTATSAATTEEAQVNVNVNNNEPVTERLIIQVASTVMPETCINFIGLCQEAAYEGTILYRIEREVGICAGDVLTNTGKTGQCWQDWPYQSEANKLALKPNPLRRDLPPPEEEPMAMWHTAGTVAMLCPKVNEIDSRFIMCGKDAPHLDGVHRAFGTMEPSSLAKIQDWQETVLTSYGQPKSVTLRIIGCGVLEDYKGASSGTTATVTQAEEAA